MSNKNPLRESKKAKNHVQFTIRMPIELHTQLKSKLANERKTMLEFFIDYTRDYVEKK